MAEKNITLPLSVEEAQLVRDACMSYSITLKASASKVGDTLSRRIHEISRYLKGQICERRK